MTSIGERLRDARVARHWSLSDVASRAEISASTLSRVETSKQNLDVGLLLVLVGILEIAPAAVLNPEEEDDESLAVRVAALSNSRRALLWRNLAAVRRDARRPSRADRGLLEQQIDELLAQLEFLQGEIRSVRTAIQRIPRRGSLSL